MGEAKRRKKLDKTFGKVRRHFYPKKPDFSLPELEKFDKFMSLPLEDLNNPENAELVDHGFELLYSMSEKSGVELPPLPDDKEERKQIFRNLKEDMAKSGLK